jgi:hypothetical protein
MRLAKQLNQCIICSEPNLGNSMWYHNDCYGNKDIIQVHIPNHIPVEQEFTYLNKIYLKEIHEKKEESKFRSNK